MGGLKESLILSLNDFPNGKLPLTHWQKSIHVEAQQQRINLAPSELQWGKKERKFLMHILSLIDEKSHYSF